MNHHRKSIFKSICAASRYFSSTSSHIIHNSSLPQALSCPVLSSFYRMKYSHYVRPTKSETNLKFDGDPDVFGNLSKNDLDLERAVQSLPDEDGDVVNVNFVDNIINKRYLRKKQYADMIKEHLKNKKLNEALDVLNVTMLKEHKAKPDNYIYNLLIDGCAQLGYTKMAFALFNQMKKRGLRPTGATYTSLFDACARSPVPGDGLTRATNLRHLIEEKAILLNSSNYHAMIKAFGWCGDIVSAFSLVDEMISKRVAPTSETFSFLLQACASNTSSGFRHALIVMKKMRDKRVPATLFTYNILLRCVRDCGTGEPGLLPAPSNTTVHHLSHKEQNDQYALTENQVTDESGISPKSTDIVKLQQLPDDPESLSKVLECLSGFLAKPKHRLMVLGGVGGLLRQMAADRVPPDVKTFTLLLSIVPSSNSAEQELITEMKKMNVPADIDFYNAVIKKRTMRKDYKAGQEVYQMIEDAGLKANLMTYGVLSLCCRSSKDANSLLSHIKFAGLRPNIEILGGLACAARHSWNPGLMCHILDVVQDEGLPPSDTFISQYEKFISFINTQLSLKERGEVHHPTLNNPRIMQSFDSLKTKFATWKKFNNTSPLPHPWTQFKRKNSSAAN